MGLDSYLTKVTYFYNDKVKGKLKIKGIPHIQKDRVTSITEEIGYWRRADALHQWFVANVQYGVDDNGEYIVSRNHLEELLKLCRKVKKNKKKAYSFIPAYSNDSYDEYYFENIDRMIKSVEVAIAEIENDETIYIMYRGSW